MNTDRSGNGFLAYNTAYRGIRVFGNRWALCDYKPEENPFWMEFPAIPTGLEEDKIYRADIR